MIIRTLSFIFFDCGLRLIKFPCLCVSGSKDHIKKSWDVLINLVYLEQLLKITEHIMAITEGI